MREFFFLAVWGGAAAAAFYLYHPVLAVAQNWIADPLFAVLATAIGLFVAALALLTLLSTLVVGRVQASRLSVLDRTLGFVFGLLRGGLVICLVYLVYTLLAPVEEHPSWLRNAKLTPLVAEGAEIVLVLVPAEWGLQGERVVRQLEETSSAIEPLVDYDDLIEPRPASGDAGNPETEGYNRSDREALDQMIEAGQ